LWIVTVAPLAHSEGNATLWLAFEKIGQFDDIHSNSSRLILAEQLGRRAPTGSSSKRLTWCSSYQALKVWT
jgi:hypothetical protein